MAEPDINRLARPELARDERLDRLTHVALIRWAETLEVFVEPDGIRP